MRRVIAVINLTIDGFCDHTVLQPDEEIHDHYTELLGSADAVLYGRITYELMKFWQTVPGNPSLGKDMKDFAMAIDRIPKIVFSGSVKDLEWNSASLATQPPEEVVARLKGQPGRDILIGSRSLIIQLMNLNLVDEYQLCVHPVMAGKGLPLSHGLNERTVFRLTRTKIFRSGAILLHYER